MIVNFNNLKQSNLIDNTIRSKYELHSINESKSNSLEFDKYHFEGQQESANLNQISTNPPEKYLLKNHKSIFSTDKNTDIVATRISSKDIEQDFQRLTPNLETVDQVITYTGSATSQADSALEADRVRNALPTSFDGTGIKIAVLSDSYNNLGGANDDIASGDLPAEGVTVIEDLPSGGSDEGRAMLQLIHDIAPGAELLFATAFGGQQEFADNIYALAEAGADIIVDDVGYLTSPFFQDGIVSQAVDDVVNNYAVTYFSSAGNSGDIAYESTEINFTSDSEGVYSNQFYDFDRSAGVDTRQTITIPQNGQVRISMQWDDPFYTTDGVDTDLDIFLLNPTDNSVVAGSNDNNLVTQTPSEFFLFKNDTAQTEFEVVITLADGVAPERIKYIPFDLGYNPANIYQEYRTDSSTIFGHPAATNAFAVGAVRYNNLNNPEPFTSAGPTTILFEADGTPKAEPEIRQKPDITAIDGTDTTFFGSGDFDNTGFPNFFGTSAAAPHAAAVAALIKQANPDFTPEQIYERLESTATDINTSGFDTLTGVGLINAYDAIFNDYVGSSNSDTFFADDRHDTIDGNAGRDRLHGEGGNDIINGGGDDDFMQGGVGNDSISGANGNDTLYGNDGDDTLLGGAGIDILVGGTGDDLLDGEADSDRLFGNNGKDTFVLRAGDTNNTIYDFEDNLDSLGLADGLESNSLTVNQTGLNTEIFVNTDLLVTLVNFTTDITDNFISV